MKQAEFETLRRAVQALSLPLVLREQEVPFRMEGGLRLRCPFHDGGNHFSISLSDRGEKKGYWHCFHPGCGVGGFFPRLLAAVLGIETPEVLKVLGIGDEDAAIQPVTEAAMEQAMTALQAMAVMDALEEEEPSEIPFRMPPGEYCDSFSPMREFLRRRGFTDGEAVIQQNSLRYAATGVFAGRMIIPIFGQNSAFVGVAARAVFPEMQPKILYPKGLAIKRLMMGSVFRWGSFEYDPAPKIPIYVVEGPMDYLKLDSLGIDVCCVFGAQVSACQQRRMVHYSGHTHWILAFDGDAAGRAGMMQAAADLIERIPDLQYVELPPGRDPGDMRDQSEFLALPRRPASLLVEQGQALQATLIRKKSLTFL